MIILAVDSSTDLATVALAKDDFPLGTYSLNTKKKHSETLLQMIEHLLKITDTPLSEVDAFAITTGPGSFTGIRIGVSTVKGLAFASQKPCISVSTVQALAQNLQGVMGLLCPVIDARRDHVYNALFLQTEQGLQRLTADRIISLDDLKTELQAQLSSYPIYLIGDAAKTAKEKMQLPLEIAPAILCQPNAESVASVALASLLKNERVCDDITLSPVYLRPTQAERERIEKEKEKTS